MTNAQRWNGEGRAPFQILVLPWRREGAKIFYAIFRRADAGYWQFIAGGGEGSELPAEAARREAREEAGIPESAKLHALESHCMIPVMEVCGRLRWGPQKLVIPEYAFGLDVEGHALKLSSEHTEYRWVDYEACHEMLHWDNNRNALCELNHRILHGMTLAADITGEGASMTVTVPKTDRLERVREVVDAIICQQPDFDQARCGYVHLYGVALLCVQLAYKRGLDTQLCGVAGMLHDISSYRTGPSPDHPRLSAQEAERILGELGMFTCEEIGSIATAIAQHGAKEATNGLMAELLKDADVAQHYLYNPALKPERRQHPRLRRAFAELGLSSEV